MTLHADQWHSESVWLRHCPGHLLSSELSVPRSLFLGAACSCRQMPFCKRHMLLFLQFADRFVRRIKFWKWEDSVAGSELWKATARALCSRSWTGTGACPRRSYISTGAFAVNGFRCTLETERVKTTGGTCDKVEFTCRFVTRIRWQRSQEFPWAVLEEQIKVKWSWHVGLWKLKPKRGLLFP